MINVSEQFKITRYTAPLDYGSESCLFYVDIVEMCDGFEAWIQHSSYGVSELMFGCPKEQSNGHDVDYDGFIEMVEANFEDYAVDYMHVYEEVI